MKRPTLLLAGIAASLATLWIAAGIVLSEGALRVPRKAVPAVPVGGKAVETVAADGAVLCGWLFTPAGINKGTVLVLHGIADSRASQIGLARMLLANQYQVLAPDSRGHGESGGAIVTYGLLESGDVHRWLDWLMQAEHPKNVFAIGESLGAAVLLQSLDGETRFRAIVAECSFANFERIAEERVAERIPLPGVLRRVAAAPLVWPSLMYARIKYGVNLRDASPEASIARTRTPVLLIHGLADSRTNPDHSRILASRNPSTTVLWLVPGAPHTGAYGTAPEEFQRRVLAWFQDHLR